MRSDSLKSGAKFVFKAISSSEVSGEVALAKLSLNLRKSLRTPIFVQNPRWASLTCACLVFFVYGRS